MGAREESESGALHFFSFSFILLPSKLLFRGKETRGVADRIAAHAGSESSDPAIL